MRKFPKLKYPSDPETDGVLAGEVVVTEKLDGADFRWTWDEDGELWIGTRNHEYRHDDENIPKAFDHAVEYIKEVCEPVDWGDNPDELVFFGEAMHLHSLEYDVEYEVPSSGSPYFKDESNVVLFDVYQEESESWFQWDGVETLADVIGLTLTNVIERGDPDDLDLDVPEESMFGGHPEGIVVRRVDGTVRAKKVTEDFAEKNATTFNDVSKAQSDGAEFVAMFVTDSRVEKQVHKLVDEGEFESPQMEMMGGGLLPQRVLTDVMTEEGWNLLNDEYGFEAEFDDDFKKEVRSKTSKKCARVLKTLVGEF